jgi:hypothetical protein
MSSARVIVIVTLSTLFLQACTSATVRNPLPAENSGQAAIHGIPNARFWGDESPLNHETWLARSDQELREEYPALIGVEHNYLALSGGGAKGAFGAGVLAGWTDAGTRPDFEIVTGVSTGALIAPMAFLGSDYDELMEKMYTEVKSDDIIVKVRGLSTLWNESAGSSAPLRSLLEKIVDDAMIEAIAAEHRRGRRLYIATTNLDAARAVLWSVSAIAASGDPKAGKLIRDIMLASASIPGVFPPVYFEVEAGGLIYDEMHMDGGMSTQVMLYPVGMDWPALESRLRTIGSPNVYVIRNAFLFPKYQQVKPKSVAIVGRSLGALIRTQGMGDIYRIYLQSQKDGLDFHLTYIPQEFDMKSNQAFDPEFMTQLFRLGRQMGRDGTAWSEIPPGFK